MFNDTSIRFLSILELSMKALQCIEKNNIGIEDPVFLSMIL
jgi:hypothetical protein